MDKIDWSDLVFNRVGLDKIDRLAVRRFGSSGLAEEASAHVVERLSENEWELLETFQGQSKPETYLYTVVSNLIEEFSRKRFGRPRPPEWLKRQGELWVTVWRMVCLERQEVPTVVDHLCFKQTREPSFIQSIIKTVKGRLPWCGHSTREIPACLRADEDENEAEFTLPDHVTPESALLQQKYSHTLCMMSMILNDAPDPEKVIDSDDAIISSQSLIDKLGELENQLSLTDEETLVLKMIYKDGLKRNFVASALNMPAHLPGRIAKRALKKIQSAFEELDIDLSEIHELTV